MQPSASPRHPWKALAVVIAMFAVVHGAWPHGGHGRGFGHVHVTDSSPEAFDCPDINVHLDDGGPDGGPVIDVFDGDDWS